MRALDAAAAAAAAAAWADLTAAACRAATIEACKAGAAAAVGAAGEQPSAAELSCCSFQRLLALGIDGIITDAVDRFAPTSG